MYYVTCLLNIPNMGVVLMSLGRWRFMNELKYFLFDAIFDGKITRQEASYIWGFEYERTFIDGVPARYCEGDYNVNGLYPQCTYPKNFGPDWSTKPNIEEDIKKAIKRLGEN